MTMDYFLDYLNEVVPICGLVALSGLFIIVGRQIVKAVLLAFDDSSPAEKQPAEPIEVDLTAFWRAVYSLAVWGAYESAQEKRKNDDPSPTNKLKNDELLGFDDEGEAVYASDFENPEGANEWLLSRRSLEDES